MPTAHDLYVQSSLCHRMIHSWFYYSLEKLRFATLLGYSLPVTSPRSKGGLAFGMLHVHGDWTMEARKQTLSEDAIRTRSPPPKFCHLHAYDLA
jgi:hypothetical protein